ELRRAGGEHRHSSLARLGPHRLEQPRLADAGRALDQDQPTPPRTRLVHQLAELGQLPLPLEQRPPVYGLHRRPDIYTAPMYLRFPSPSVVRRAAHRARSRPSQPRTWTDERILAALRDWFDAFGETPLSYEWSPRSADLLGLPT